MICISRGRGSGRDGSAFSRLNIPYQDWNAFCGACKVPSAGNLGREMYALAACSWLKGDGVYSAVTRCPTVETSEVRHQRRYRGHTMMNPSNTATFWGSVPLPRGAGGKM